MLFLAFHVQQGNAYCAPCQHACLDFPRGIFSRCRQRDLACMVDGTLCVVKRWMHTLIGDATLPLARISPPMLFSVTTMQSAISSGAPEEVTALMAILESMNKASITRELTGCYGGRRGNPPRVDEHGLFRMTMPLLHAAFTGSTRMFHTVLGAMRAKLRAPQARCGCGSSL